MDNVLMVLIGIGVIYLSLGFKYGSFQVAIIVYFEIILALFFSYGYLEKADVQKINHYFSYVVYTILFLGFFCRACVFFKKM